MLENPYPPSGNQVLRKLRTNNGLLLKANNEAILEAMRLLSQEGIFAQPASATALAGLIQAINKKMIPAGSRVVVVVTGSGLKYLPVLKEFDVSPVSVELDKLSQVISDHQQSWGYEDGPWKGPRPSLLVAADLIHKPPASIKFTPMKHALAVSVEPFKFSPA